MGACASALRRLARAVLLATRVLLPYPIPTGIGGAGEDQQTVLQYSRQGDNTMDGLLQNERISQAERKHTDRDVHVAGQATQTPRTYHHHKCLCAKPAS
jgi:hypothetical protein